MVAYYMFKSMMERLLSARGVSGPLSARLESICHFSRSCPAAWSGSTSLNTIHNLLYC